MWISRKFYNFLKGNAEKNIDMECQILTAKENERRAVARAMEEYSSVLKERDELKLRVIELEHQLKKFRHCTELSPKAIKDLKYYLDTNEENGVVYIPRFIVEKIVNNT